MRAIWYLFYGCEGRPLVVVTNGSAYRADSDGNDHQGPPLRDTGEMAIPGGLGSCHLSVRGWN